MNKLTLIATALMALLLGACTGRTYQLKETTPDGTYVRNVNSGAFHDHETEEYDSRVAYRNCLADMNRRQMGPAAVDYCRNQVRSDRRKRSNVQNGEAPGGSMTGAGMYGPGAMMSPGIYGPGMGMPLYPAPPGQLDYEVYPGQPAYRSSGSDAADQAHWTQTADNANKIDKVRKRVDRLEHQDDPE